MSTVISASALDIIQEALLICRVIDPEQPLEASDRRRAIRGLNYLVKQWQQPFHLWSTREAYLPLVKGQVTYKLGPGGDECFSEDEAIFTTLSADALAGATTVSLTDDSEVVAAPEILGSNVATSTQDWTATDGTISADANGLLLTNSTGQAFADYTVDTTVGSTYIFVYEYTKGTDSGAVFTAKDIDGDIVSDTSNVSGSFRLEFTARQKQTTFEFKNETNIVNDDNTLASLNYIDKSTGDRIGIISNDRNIQWSNVIFKNPITLADSLLEASDSGNTVYAYSNIIDRPLDIINLRYRDSITTTDIPTTQWTRKEYFEQPDKTTQSIITKWFYNPTRGNGTLRVWGAPSSDQNILPFTYIQPLEVSEDNADQVDFPSEWYFALAYNLAVALAPTYSVPDVRFAQIKQEAQERLDDVLYNDNEYTSMSIEPSYRE